MTGLLIFYLKKDDSSRWMVALGGIVVSALPISLLFVKNNPFNIPIIIGYYVFVFCTTFLGSIANFYVDFKWWDSALHFYKGIFVGFVGIALYKLFHPSNGEKRYFKVGHLSFLFFHFQSLSLFFGKYMNLWEISLLLKPCSEAVTKIPCTI